MPLQLGEDFWLYSELVAVVEKRDATGGWDA